MGGVTRPVYVLCAVFAVVLVVVVVAEYFIVDHIVSKDSSSTEPNVDLLVFPSHVMIAAATSSYQIEGAWNVSDKGLSIWDTFSHAHLTDTGDDACKSYEKYKTDVQMLVQTGFDAYRFSISWPRVLPKGTTDYKSKDGIQYYHNLIDELLAYNITPLVTLYHWDLPQVFQDEYNGWLNSSMADLFAAYAGAMFEEYGDKVKHWLTINEPQSIVIGYIGNGSAPGYPGTREVEGYIVNHNLLRAHGKAYQVYNTTYRPTQNGSIGITFYLSGIFPNDDSSYEDRQAALREWEFSGGLYANPIYSVEGNYPTIVRERVDSLSLAENRSESRLPHFTDEELEQLRGSADFIGVNNYGSNYVTGGGSGDSGVTTVKSAEVGEGLRNLLNWVKKMYNGVPTFIMENGCNTSPGLDDTARVELYHAMLRGVLEAIHLDGCPVIGYTAWSLMDNYEWSFGYARKFGIWEVDFVSENRTRTMKESAYWFKELLSTRRLPDTTNFMK